MKRNYTKEEMEELLICLASEDEEVSDFAMDALLMANPERHLSVMLKTLEFADDIVKQRICYILGGIIDKRCVDPLLSILNDENIDTVVAALDSLQYFHEERIIPHLKKQLMDNNAKIQEAVIETLGAYIKHGIPGACLPLVDLIQEEEELLDLRLLAVSKLEYLEEDQLKPILEDLMEISNATIYSHILMLYDDLNENKKKKLFLAEKLVNKLLAEEDIMKQINIQDQLVEFGGITARVLIKKMTENPQNASLSCFSHLILDRLGTKSIAAFKTLFESFDRFSDIHQRVLLITLVSIIAEHQFASLAPSLLKLLGDINNYVQTNGSDKTNDGFTHLKSEIHLALAKCGSREAIDDLREIFKDGSKRHFIQFIEAIQNIGDKHFLIPLLNQYDLYRNISIGEKAIKKAFKAVVRREKIKANDPLLNSLTEPQKKSLKLILPKLCASAQVDR